MQKKHKKICFKKKNNAGLPKPIKKKKKKKKKGYELRQPHSRPRVCVCVENNKVMLFS
jgi:hypothetical protein